MALVQVLFGFDVERPYGIQARTNEGREEREANLELIGRLSDLMDEHGVSRTFFILGEYLEVSAEQVGNKHLRQVFRPENPLVEIAQHTYSHVIVAPIKTRPDKTPVPLDSLKDELKKADKIIKNILGTEKLVGLRTPLGYSDRELDGKYGVLNVMKSAGLEYVSSNLRNPDGGINAPLKTNGHIRSPFEYSNGLIEMPSHGWQDTAFTGESKTQGTENYPTTPDGIAAHYAGLISQAQLFSKQMDEETEFGKKIQTIQIGFCMHPWAIRRYDPNLEVISRIIDVCKREGIANSTYRNGAQRAREDMDLDFQSQINL